MKFEQIKTAMVLAPHPDDGEFGCGGTIKKLIENKVEVWYVCFSPCNKSLPEGFEEGALYKELKNATAKLGIPENNLITYDYPVRVFPINRQLILDNLVSLKKEKSPDLVLLPNSKDVHQDHHTIHSEGVRAFKQACILGYELPWNSFEFTNNMHVKLEKEHIDAKVNAIKEYKSQEFRQYKDSDFYYGLAKVRGNQVNAEYAEAFELIHWVV